MHLPIDLDIDISRFHMYILTWAMMVAIKCSIISVDQNVFLTKCHYLSEATRGICVD